MLGGGSDDENGKVESKPLFRAPPNWPEPTLDLV